MQERYAEGVSFFMPNFKTSELLQSSNSLVKCVASLCFRGKIPDIILSADIRNLQP